MEWPWLIKYSRRRRILVFRNLTRNLVAAAYLARNPANLVLWHQPQKPHDLN